jgi:hypothetical protein
MKKPSKEIEHEVFLCEKDIISYYSLHQNLLWKIKYTLASLTVL